MGLIGRLLSFVRVDRDGVKSSDVQFDPGGGAILTGAHFAPPGDDSQPLPEDYVATIKNPRTGSRDVVGYIDTKNAGITAKGEKRIYGRDENGVIVVDIFLKGDGSAIMANENGIVELKANGVIDLNGVTIDTNGKITAPNDIVASGGVTAGAEVTAGNAVPATAIKLTTHTHISAPPGSPTSPPTPGT